MKRTFAVLLLAMMFSAAPVVAQCTLRLSDEGVVRIQSGEEHKLTWNAVPGASSYYLQETIDGLNEPSGPDFTFGGAYTESRNYEGRAMTQFDVNHGVTYKTRFRYTVTALNRENASWQPCSDEVLFVVEPDAALATLASLRIVPIAGKSATQNNGNRYSTALILAGTGLGPSRQDPPSPPRPDGTVNPPYDDLPKLYQGRVYFRPLGTVASDTDPSIEYALGGEETLVFDDIMERLGVTGIGTLEVRPKAGYPTPLVDAIIENRAGNSTAVTQKTRVATPAEKRGTARVPGVLARNYLRWSDTGTVAIRNEADTQLVLGLRTIGEGFGRVVFTRFAANGLRVGFAERFVNGNQTSAWPIADLFTTPLVPGDRIVAGYSGFSHVEAPAPKIFRLRAGGAIFFVADSVTDLSTPMVTYREPIRDPFHLNGFDPFVVY